MGVWSPLLAVTSAVRRPSALVFLHPAAVAVAAHGSRRRPHRLSHDGRDGKQHVVSPRSSSFRGQLSTPGSSNPRGAGGRRCRGSRLGCADSISILAGRDRHGVRGGGRAVVAGATPSTTSGSRGTGGGHRARGSGGGAPEAAGGGESWGQRPGSSAAAQSTDSSRSQI